MVIILDSTKGNFPTFLLLFPIFWSFFFSYKQYWITTITDAVSLFYRRFRENIDKANVQGEILVVLCVEVIVKSPQSTEYMS